MKRIEILVRSDAWDRETKAEFLAWLDKPMRDDARLGYCQRKACFMLRSALVSRLRAALRLIDWAIARFSSAEPRTLWLARSARGQLRTKLRKLGATPEAEAISRGSRP